MSPLTMLGTNVPAVTITETIYTLFPVVNFLKCVYISIIIIFDQEKPLVVQKLQQKTITKLVW